MSQVIFRKCDQCQKIADASVDDSLWISFNTDHWSSEITIRSFGTCREKAFDFCSIECLVAFIMVLWSKRGCEANRR